MKYFRAPKMRVMTNGCFDIFHIGHLQLINYSKDLGDELFVAINSDNSIKNLKGQSRPIMSENYRLNFIRTLSCVSHAEIFDETDCAELVYKWKPNIYVKSTDYNIDSLNKKEKKALQDIKADIKFMKITEDISTSKIISKIKNIT